MPKIKDLGINAIPLTMQPPAIGDGGGGGAQGDWTGRGSKCGTPGGDQGGEQVWTGAGSSGTGSENCGKQGGEQTWTGAGSTGTGSENCGKQGGEQVWTGGGGGSTCKSTKATGFTPEAIAHVRQQIADQSATL